MSSPSAQPSPSFPEDLPVPTPSGGATGGPGQPGATGGAGQPGATGKPAAPTTLTGTVTAGVEPNCLLLSGYLLVGGPREQLRDGARVTVTGRVQAGLMTTCQQGTPFVVESVQPA
ncbi:hypothetical protein ACNTMW_16400 [Planosporangium sp. 12N6]|uniref:hypothetical protein n=1 Tax=Planosporangium spinosum TaxID=3402278 RepID=UPI003CE9675C